MKNIKSENGSSLVIVIIIAMALGGLAIGIMRLLDNVSTNQTVMKNSADEVQLYNTVGLILSDSKHCRVSTAGEGVAMSPSSPVVFSKTNIDEETEGLDIELFLGNQVGDARETLKLSSTDTTASKFGKLKIVKIRLIMDHGVGFDYLEKTSHQDLGHIIVDYQKMINGQPRNLKMKFKVKVTMKTNLINETTILGCKLAGAGSTMGGALAGFEGRELGTFSVNNASPSVVIDLTSYVDAKFLYMNGICKCSSTGGNASVSALINHADGTSKTYFLCRSSQAGVKFPGVSSIPISPLESSITLNMQTSCSGNSFADAVLLK